MNIRKAGPEDVGPILDLIRRRIRWMDEIGLDHWNKVDYFGIYPERYYEENGGGAGRAPDRCPGFI